MIKIVGELTQEGYEINYWYEKNLLKEVRKHEHELGT